MNREYSYWEEIYNAYGETEKWMCHNCGHTVYYTSNFCPECGRVMTGCKKDNKYTIVFNVEKIKECYAGNEPVLNNCKGVD